MDEFGLPTSFGRAPKTAKLSINTNTNTNTSNSNPTQQRSNGPAGGGRRGGRQEQGKEQGQGARTSPYPIHSAAGDASADMQVDGFQGHGHGRGRGRGRGAPGSGGRGRGRGGNRVSITPSRSLTLSYISFHPAGTSTRLSLSVYLAHRLRPWNTSTPLLRVLETANGDRTGVYQ